MATAFKTASILKTTLRTASLDISAGLGEPANTTIFEWQEPDTAKLFTAPGFIPNLMGKNPEWTPGLARVVALLALCHVAPETEDDPLIVYQAIARDNPHLFGAISETFNGAFPELENFGVAVDDAKNA